MRPSFTVFILLLPTLFLAGCPDGTPGKETVKNKWEDMVDELKEMDKASMKKNWKRYYLKAIEALREKEKTLTNLKIERMTDLKIKEKELGALEERAGKARKIIKGGIEQLKNAKSEVVSTNDVKISIQNREYSPKEAKKLLKKWGREFQRKYSSERVALLIKTVKKYTDIVGKLDIALELYKDKIQQLTDTMENFEAELELVKARESLNALCVTGSELDALGSGIPQLDKLKLINKGLNRAIARSEVEGELVKQERDLETKFTSLESEIDSVGSDLKAPELKEINDL
jgi:hypothetical protein